MSAGPVLKSFDELLVGGARDRMVHDLVDHHVRPDRSEDAGQPS
jgi:hypothetical protein